MCVFQLVYTLCSLTRKNKGWGGSSCQTVNWCPWGVSSWITRRRIFSPFYFFPQVKGKWGRERERERDKWKWQKEKHPLALLKRFNSQNIIINFCMFILLFHLISWKAGNWDVQKRSALIELDSISLKKFLSSSVKRK